MFYRMEKDHTKTVGVMVGQFLIFLFNSIWPYLFAIEADATYSKPFTLLQHAFNKSTTFFRLLDLIVTTRLRSSFAC